jgi:hypothetical protein
VVLAPSWKATLVFALVSSKTATVAARMVTEEQPE